MSLTDTEGLSLGYPVLKKYCKDPESLASCCLEASEGERDEVPPGACSSLASETGGETRFAMCGGRDRVGRRGETPVGSGDADSGEGSSDLICDGMLIGGGRFTRSYGDGMPGW